MAENGRFVGPRGPNFNPLFTKKLFVLEGQISFKCRLLNMGKNIIFKNQKKSFTRKISKSEKLRKWPKKGQK